MGYRVHRDSDKFKIVEVADGSVRDIITDLAEPEAKLISSNMNKGSGFDGKIPSFFLEKFVVSV